MNLRRQPVAGAAFGDAETNKLVESGAIAFVTDWYRARDWNIASVERDRCGYDLHCTNARKELHVEVKGLQGEFGAFNITAGEVERARSDPNFVLCVVARATSPDPELCRYTGEEFQESFNLKPIQFRAVPCQ